MIPDKCVDEGMNGQTPPMDSSSFLEIGRNYMTPFFSHIDQDLLLLCTWIFDSDITYGGYGFTVPLLLTLLNKEIYLRLLARRILIRILLNCINYCLFFSGL